MFWVLSREKIKSYLISVGTIAFLFVMAFVLRNNELYETSAKLDNTKVNIIKKENTQNQIIQNEIIE